MNRSPVLALAVLVVVSALVSWSPPAAAATTYGVQGRVVSDAGEPLADVTVHGVVYGSDSTHEDKTQTAKDGTFTLRLPAGKGALTAVHSEWGGRAHRDLLVEGNVSDVTLTLRAPPPRTAIVEGRVLDANGAPLAGATVRLERYCCYAYDAGDGHAEGREVPPSPPAEGSGGGASASSEPMIMPSPICCHEPAQEKTTGADGSFRFTTVAGPAMLVAYAKGHAQTSAEIEAKDNATVTKDLRLVKVPAADAVLKGRVVDARTGAPLADAQVVVNNLEWGRHAIATTGADGSYELKTLPGWSLVNVYVMQHGYAVPIDAREGDADAPAPLPKTVPGGANERSYYQYQHALALASGETKHEIKLVPKPEPTVVLQGYVVDPTTQKGVAGATVNVWNQDTGDWGGAVTDAAGSYKMTVRPGHYTATSWAEGHLQGAATFVIDEDERLKRVDLQSPKGETRYAPCDDCDHERAIASTTTSMDASTVSEGGEASAYEGAPGKSAPPAPMAASSGSTTGAAYFGGGGGLPPYDPQEAPRADAETIEVGANAVPGLGAVALVAALGLAALVARRR